MNRERLLSRFLQYVKVDTTAREEAGVYPSSPGQIELGKLLLQQLKELGLKDASQSEQGIVMATVPSNVDREAPVVALNSHVDTSPETSGRNIKPNVIRNYAGGDIILPGDANKVIRVGNNSELKSLHGKTIITSDGTTLLGADDKAGVAVIMETAAWLMENPSISHGPVRICFTCDEEIGHGVDHVDLKKLGATVCYTLDGQGAGEIDVETFSADLAVITVRGVNIHPSIGKGRMVNAIRGAADFIAALPLREQSPETTSDRQGFLHPYVCEASVAEAKIRVLLRDFDTAGLAPKAELLRQTAEATMQKLPGLTIDVNIVPQYRNMADGLKTEPRAVAFVEQAYANLGLPCKRTIVRGGTDGSRFTELGLPTPNLSTGEHNPHSPLEWACLEEMEQAGAVLVELLKIWGQA